MSDLNLIQVIEGTKGYGPRNLFESSSFSINENEHVGVIGPNGAGKTTLFRIIAGRDELDSGVCSKSKSLRIGYLAQEDEWDLDSTLEEYLERECVIPIWDLKQLGKDLGLTEEYFKTPIKKLSGGYRMRAQLLYIIGCDPNLMLLDEPTNYLDLESLLILENFLRDYKGAFMLISHDREFLKRVADHILEVEGKGITKFPGNIDDYFEQKSLLREQLEKRSLSVEAKRTEIMNFVNRFRAKASKARQAQSRLKQVGKLEKVEIKALPVTARISIPTPVRTGKLVLETKNLSLGYGDKTVLSNVNIQLVRGDHLGVVGVNGAGKSTLLKGIAGILNPQAGKIEKGPGVEIAYFAQHLSEQLKPNYSVYDSFIADAHRDVTEQQIKELAGSLLFSGDDIHKKISVLSGGERTRVALGKVLLSKAPVLLFDEPTNHLDFSTVEALTQALKKFAGTVVVISHDRGFIGRISSRILEINHGKVSLFPGNYDEYLWSVEKGAFGANQRKLATQVEKDSQPEKQAIAQAGGDTLAGETPKVNFKDKRKSLERYIRIANTSAEKLEERLESYRVKLEKLAGDMGGASPSESQKLAEQASELQKSIDLDEYRWMEFVEERESLESELDELLKAFGAKK